MATAPKTRAKKAAADPAPPAPAGTNAPITDKKLVALAEQYALAAPEKNRLEKFLKEAKPVLLQAMRDAPTAYVGNRVVTRTDVVGTPDTVGEKISRAMVGQHMLGKKGRPQSRTRSAADAPAARPEVVPATSACLATPDPTAADPSSNHPSSRVLRRPFESAEYRFAVLAQARYACAAGGLVKAIPDGWNGLYALPHGTPVFLALGWEQRDDAVEIRERLASGQLIQATLH
jgi:hypothetical protein